MSDLRTGQRLNHASGTAVEVVRVLSPNMIEVRALQGGSIHFVGREELATDPERDTEPAPPPCGGDE